MVTHDNTDLYVDTGTDIVREVLEQSGHSVVLCHGRQDQRREEGEVGEGGGAKQECLIAPESIGNSEKRIVIN